MAKELTEPSSPTRPRGRPARAEGVQLEHVSTRLPAPYLDRICKLALKQDKSVSEIVRQLLIIKLR